MKHHPHFSSRQRPPWWPENEEWPPKRWRHMRGNPFFRRLGCFFFGFSVFAFIGLLGILRLVLDPFVEFHGRPMPMHQPEFVFPFGFFGVVILLAALYLGARSLRRMSIPLDDLLNASNRVADGDYSVRVDEKGPPEVRSLTEAFNSMAERLDVNDKQRRNMLADISHELRSPITIMQGNLEGMLDGVYAVDKERLHSLYDETQILSRLVDDLRTLSLAESGALHLKRELTDLGLLIREVATAFESQAQEKEIKIELALGDIEDLEIDPQRIREVLSNLVSNALRYTPSQGTVKVGATESTSTEESGALTGATISKRSVLVYVQDSGPGIEPADLSRIFDRFYKSSDSGGMGLGLSIAKYLVEAHGGQIWAESDIVPAGEAGQGTKISFTLRAW